MITDTSAQDRLINNSTKGLRSKILLVIIAGLVLAAFLLQIFSKDSDLNINRDRIRTGLVTRGDFIKDVRLQGKVIAAHAPTVYAPSGGKVSLLHQAGATIKAGQLVARLDSPSLTSRLQQEQAELQRLKVALERKQIESKQTNIRNQQNIALEKVSLEAAKRELKRAKRSLAIKVISQLEYEKSVDELRRAELSYKFLQQNAELELENLSFEQKTLDVEIEQFAFKLAETQRQVNALNIVAPVNGRIGTWMVEQKAAVTANQALLTIIDLSQYEVEIEIPEAYADQIVVGMGSTIELNNTSYNGRVTAISPEVNNQIVKGRVAFVAEIPSGLKQNQRVNSRVLLEKKQDVLIVPRGSFVQHHGGQKVFVVENDIAQLQAISLGSYGVSEIEVIAGLKEGQELIISNTDFVKQATTLKIN